ncbi:MAG TPA: hypothetical protein VHM90_14530 [Phycisphaerae bacterium]|jgi:hypothetical protein|nr:hypothetical protein [Phycisphaerae bacterium]
MMSSGEKSSAPLERDVRCIHCQYNLRTLLPEGRCPECGNAVGDSLRHYAAHAGALARAGMLRTGIYCLAGLGFAAWPVHVIFAAIDPVQAPPRMLDLLEILAHMGFVALLCAGTLLVSTALGRTVVHGSIRALLAAVAAVYAASALVSSLGMLGMLFSRRQRGAAFRVHFVEYLLRDQRIFTALALLILAVIGFFLMRRLARTLASPALERASRLSFAALALGAAFCFATYLWLGAFRIRPTITLEPILEALDSCMGVVGVLMGSYWLFAGKVVREHARKTPTARDLPPATGAIPAREKVAQFLGVPPAGTSH